MLNIYVCEDNLEQRKRFSTIINDLIKDSGELKLEISTSNPYELLDNLEKSNATGIYFLDINLHSSINGIQLAEKIRHYDPRGFIIFITSHAEMSYLTFVYKVEAMDYIIKDNYSNISERFRQCIDNALMKHKGRNTPLKQTFSVKVDDRIINIPYEDILFFETSSTIHKIRIHCYNRQVEFYGKMKNLEGLLDDTFYRCHTSFIINLNKIKEIDKTARIAYMINGEQCLISIRGLKAIINRI